MMLSPPSVMNDGYQEITFPKIPVSIPRFIGVFAKVKTTGA